MVALTSYAQTSQRAVLNAMTWQMGLQIIGASLLLAFCSQIKLVLPFTPVPITFQTLAVLLIGVSLGSRAGALAILCYFAEILMGLPVLSGGTVDPLIFLGPKGGYVLGFCAQAFCMGWFVEKSFWSRNVTLLIGGLVSCALQLTLGMWMLAAYVGWNHVIMMGCVPFIPGEILKVLVVAFGMNKFQSKLFN